MAVVKAVTAVVMVMAAVTGNIIIVVTIGGILVTSRLVMLTRLTVV
jgi:hypothetical protein